MSKKCKDCKFFYFQYYEGSYSIIECRRYAPRMVRDSGGCMSKFRFPKIDPEKDWCGEFQPKEMETK